MTNATAPAQTPTNGTAPKTEPRDYNMVGISVPPELHKHLEEQAKAQKVSTSVLVRRLVAAAVNFDIAKFEQSRRRGRVKYETEEERKNAQTERAATVKALVARYERGEIKLDEDEIKAAAATIKSRKPKADKAPATATAGK